VFLVYSLSFTPKPALDIVVLDYGVKEIHGIIGFTDFDFICLTSYIKRNITLPLSSQETHDFSRGGCYFIIYLTLLAK